MTEADDSGLGDPGGAVGARPVDAAKLAEERYRALVANLPNSAILLCDHDLRIVLVDGPESIRTGYSKAAMEGRTIYECLPPEFVGLVESNMRRVLAGESFSAELPFGDLWYTYNYVPIRNDQGDIVYGMILSLNVTERRRAEEEAKRSQTRLATMFQLSPDAMGVSTVEDGTFIEVNRAFEQLFGWSRDEVVGKRVEELDMWVLPEQREALVRAFREQGSVDRFDVLVRRKDGVTMDGLAAVRAADLDGRDSFLFVVRDVSEQRRAERALAEREAHFRALAQATFEGIAFTEGGRIVDANEQLAGMLGTTRGELLGKDVATFVAPESALRVREHLQSGSEEPYEHLAVRFDGSRFDAEARPRTTQVDGRALRVTAVRDVSERKQREVERERLISELSTRNAEMEQFTYTVSHDLKSPLVTINGFLGMLERDLAEGNQERVASDLARIGSAADKMLRLLNDLLELSRVGRVGDKRTGVSLVDAVNDALELLSGPIAERRVRVEVAALPQIAGDRTRLAQVFQNLIENAVKNMGDQPAPLIEIGVRPEPRHVVVFVRDNGPGIDPRHASRIFGLFEKLDPKSPGNGVGLALVRRIVEFHGGQVSVESDGRTGSTFVLRFPV